MHFEHDCYYHLYNRSNAGEIVFKSEDNYAYFLKNFRRFLGRHFGLVAYCLMPTHFHLLVRFKGDAESAARDAVGVWLSSYTKAINKRHGRHGSLFQQHSKAKHIADERYLVTVLTYMHQNPLRAGMVGRLEDWPHSSYPDLAGYRKGARLERYVIELLLGPPSRLRALSRDLIPAIDGQCWP